MKQILARVIEIDHCPLYNLGDSLVYAPPSVRCDSGSPVCAVAVQRLQKPFARITAGKNPAKFLRWFCGGCGEGNRAWFEFRAYVVPDTKLAVERADPEVVSALKKSFLFSSFPEEKIGRCVEFFQAAAYNPFDLLITQGNSSPGVFILLSGKVEIVRSDGSGKEWVIATLDEGDCFGEMSVITGQPATATVRAVGEVKVTMCPRDDVGKLYTILPTLPTVMARLLAARLASMSAEMVRGMGSAMKGRLDSMPAADLVQSVAIARLSGKLVVEAFGRKGILTFADGRLLHAEVEDRTGEEAVYEFVSWTEGAYEFVPGDPGTARTVDREATGLLLEGLRRMDEFREETRVRVLKRR